MNRSPIVAANKAAIAEAAAHLRAGRLVAFPTETVYGLGADAGDDRAVARIFEAKDRPGFNPLIVHVPDAAQAARHVRFNPAAERLAEALWPGALTLVLPRVADCGLSELVSAGLPSAALRVPDHPVGQALLRAAGRPIAAPSANRSGRVSPTTARHVAEELGDKVAMILDGGGCAIGLESSVVGFDAEDAPVLLRPGGVTVEAIEAIVGPLAAPADSPERPSSPGRMLSHYAPGRPLRLAAIAVAADEGLLAFGPVPLAGAAVTRNLSPSGDLVEAAANLFAYLRDLDAARVRAIAVMAIPEAGLGRAINDRLRRAEA